jgi:hypothetical protein
MAQNSNFGIYPDIDDAQITALLQSGVPMFQILHPKPRYYDMFVGGPIKATAYIPSVEFEGRNARMPVTWETKHPSITFHHTKMGTSSRVIGWVPDDRFWHNRIVIMENAWMRSGILQLRMPDNRIINGAEASMQISVLEKMLKKKYKIYKVMDKSFGEISYFYTKKEADNFIEGKLADNKEIKLFDGQIQPLNRQRIDRIKSWTIVEGERTDYREDIISLINRERKKGHRFGWTECSEFASIQKQCIKEMTKQATGSSTGNEGLDVVKSVLQSFNKDDLARMLKERMAEEAEEKKGELIK